MGRRARDESDDEDVVSEEDEDEDDVDVDSASDDDREDDDDDDEDEEGGSDSELEAEMAALASIQRERQAAKSGNKDAKTFANNAAGLDASIEGACVCVCVRACEWCVRVDAGELTATRDARAGTD